MIMLIFRLTKQRDYEKFGCTSVHGDFYYYNYNSGLQNQWVYYQQQKLGEKGKVFLDVNGLSADGLPQSFRRSGQ
uniref:Peptidase S9A N-terminal domain-containing protein n=1 Tax=Ditylenchus dipsaci TaxID=166011 RepID=A0A915EKB7_9BILA